MTKKHTKVILFILLYASLPLLMISTNPEKLNLSLLIVPFIILFLVVYVTARKIMSLTTHAKNTQIKISAGIMAFMLTMIVVLQSLHQLTLKDLLLSLFTSMFLSWYLLKINR